MPLFAYACGKCDHEFEYLSRSGEAAPECPKCGASRIERQFAPFGVATGSSRAPSGCSMEGGPAACPRAGGPGCGA